MPSTRTSTQTLSVYGGAGGQGTRISSSEPKSIYGSCQSNSADDFFTSSKSGNEKAMMQNLNDRLASVIQKVQSLKNSNAEYQRKIKEWSASHTVAARDYSGYLATIESLNKQIQHMSKSNTNLVLDIENASLFADDFRQLYETELAFRKSVETDAAYTRKQMDEMTLTRSTLEMEYENLKKEHILLQKNHEKEKDQIQTQAGHQVDISVDAAPSTDLNGTLTKMRKDYEAVVAKNRKDQEVWYQKKISTLEKKFTEQTDDLENMTTEVGKLRTFFHKLQIKREAQESMSTSLEANLQDSSTHYAAQLAQFQNIINDLESELKEIRDNITAKKEDSNTLETEIKKYRLLLEAMTSDVQVARRKIAVIKVVESSETNLTVPPFTKPLCSIKTWCVMSGVEEPKRSAQSPDSSSTPLNTFGINWNIDCTQTFPPNISE